MLTIGDRFPEFKLRAAVSTAPGKEFADIDNNTYAKKWRVYFFWPMDFTFVCPTEIIGFGERNAEFEKLGAQVLGGSIDTHHVHLAWRNSHPGLKNLPFPMLADTKRELCTALGILNAKGVAHRATFIVDPEGVIRHVSVNDNAVGRSVSETVRVLAALQTGELTACEWKPGTPTLNAA